MQIINPCLKCIVRSTCIKNCEQYDKFLPYYALTKVVILVLSSAIGILGVNFLWLFIMNTFDIPQDRIPVIGLVFMLVIVPLGLFVYMWILSYKYYPIEVRSELKDKPDLSFDVQ